MITRKLCLLGAFSVGKTSLMRRFVQGVFDERYISTLGVKIDTKTVELGEDAVKLVIWDIEGADPADHNKELISTRMKAYLAGTDGLLLVADGTRLLTIDTAREIYRWFRSDFPGVPVALLLNKSDLVDDWQAGEGCPDGFDGLLQCFTTSALSGANVERTFLGLSNALVSTQDVEDGNG